MEYFNHKDLKSLFRPEKNSNGEDNGQLTIIGGSSLFHGAPIFSLKAASRVVDMVFFSSPEKGLEKVTDYIKSEISSFVWTPFSEVDLYIEKSDAILIGPGFMRFTSEKDAVGPSSLDDSYLFTRKITQDLLNKFPSKKWVIDAGSLQSIDPSWIPQDAIITPNKKEFRLLFGLPENILKDLPTEELSSIVQEKAKAHNCIIVLKGPDTIVASSDKVRIIEGGNAGLTKGGTGDTQAGLTAALLAKNEPFLAACCAAFVVKKSAEELYTRVGTYFNAEDLAEEVPRTLASYVL